MKYSAKYKPMAQTVSEIYEVSKKIDRLSTRLDSLASDMGYLMWQGQTSGIRAGVQQRSANVSGAARVVKNFGGTLDESRIDYLVTEQKIYQLLSGDKSLKIGEGAEPIINYGDLALDFIKQILPISGTPKPYSQLITSLLMLTYPSAAFVPLFQIGNAVIGSLSEIVSRYTPYIKATLPDNMEFMKRFSEVEAKGGNDEFKDIIKQKEKNYEGNRPDLQWADKTADFIKIEKKNGVDLLKISGENGSITIGEAEYHGSFSAGLYSYDNDGNKKFTPGVEAAVGASVSLFSAEASKHFGVGGENSNWIGGYGSIEGTAGKAEVGANLTATVFDKDGKLKPQLHGKLEAEAIAAEIKGSAGVTVLGTDIGVTGGVSFGIGAHADAGFVDGKFKVDAGLAFGLGVQVGFEVDFGGTVDAVCSAAQSGWNAFKGWIGGGS